MNSANTSISLQTWSVTYARVLGAIALILPIIGAAIYHIEDFSDVGQAHFVLSFGRLFIIGALFLMLLMPKTFRQILDAKRGLDELERHLRTQTYFHSYRLILLVVFLLLIGTANVANSGMAGVQMRSFLVTVFTMILAYSMIIPFNILSWTMTPPDDE